MARILYGLCGEGMGHAIRSKVVLDHLSKKNEVVIVTSNRAYEYLSKHFNNVHDIYGYGIVYEKNKVKNFETLVQNMKGLRKEAIKSLKTIYSLIRKYKPDVIISDFEPFTNTISKMLNIPLISVDNMHIITNCKIKIPIKYRAEYVTSKMIIDSFVNTPKAYIITSFFFPKIKRKRTYLVKPILRESILEAKPKKGDYILVYQTSTSNQDLFEFLKNIDEKFIVYGFNEDKKIKNLVYRKFSENQMVNELAGCKAVITNGGFTLISEAIHLGKPVLSIPVRKHFEQTANGISVKECGYGEFYKHLDEDKLREFITNLKIYEENLKGYEQEDNSRCLNLLDKLIEKY